MTSQVHKRLAVMRVWGEALRILARGLPLFFQIAAFAAVLLVTAGATVVAINWGVSGTRAEIDPRVLTATITGRQFAVLGAGILVSALVLSYAAAAAILGAVETAAGGRLSLVQAVSRVRAKGMQLFWLQWVVNILAVRFSVVAAPVLWLLLAPALPLAVIEDAGPSEAVERTFELLRRNLGRMLALELLLLVPLALLPAALGAVMLPLGFMDLPALSPLAGLLISFPMMTVLLLPVLFQFIALTSAYLDLSTEPEVHVPGGSSVS